MHVSSAATANATWGGKGTPNAKQVNNELVPVVCAFFFARIFGTCVSAVHSVLVCFGVLSPVSSLCGTWFVTWFKNKPQRD